MMQRMKGTLRPGRKAGVLALAVLLLTCVLMAGAVSAATYYVNENGGDDSNTGTSPDSPFATIQKAVDTATAGDCILVEAGTYDAFKIDTGKPGLTIQGTVEENSLKTTIRTLYESSPTWTDYGCGGIDISSPSITLKNLSMKSEGYTKGRWYASPVGHWNENTNDKNGLTIDNCEITNAAADGKGIAIFFVASDITILDTSISGFNYGWHMEGSAGMRDISITDSSFDVTGSAINYIPYVEPTDSSASAFTITGTNFISGNVILWDYVNQMSINTPSTSTNSGIQNVQLSGNDYSENSNIILINFKGGQEAEVTYDKSPVMSYSELKYGVELNPGASELVINYGSSSEITYTKENDSWKGDDGSVCDKDGEPYFAKIGDAYHYTLDAALGTAKDGDTVTLLQDVSLTNALTIDKAITLTATDSADKPTLTVPQVLIDVPGVTLDNLKIQQTEDTDTKLYTIQVTAYGTEGQITVTDSEIIPVTEGRGFSNNAGAAFDITFTGNIVKAANEGDQLAYAIYINGYDNKYVFQENIIGSCSVSQFGFDQYVDALNTPVDISKNYWGGLEPSIELFVGTDPGEPDLTGQNVYYTLLDDDGTIDEGSLHTPGIILVSGGSTTYFDTIEDALNAAADGDTIKIAAGEYELTSALTINKGVTITANDPAAKPTIKVPQVVVRSNTGVTLESLNIVQTGTSSDRVLKFVGGTGDMAVKNCVITALDGGSGVAFSSQGDITFTGNTLTADGELRYGFYMNSYEGASYTFEENIISACTKAQFGVDQKAATLSAPVDISKNYWGGSEPTFECFVVEGGTPALAGQGTYYTKLNSDGTIDKNSIYPPVEPTPQPTPVPPSGGSSGDGNMENAYRVLFNDGSTTLSVVTDLSSGDKLTKPETPVKDGYTFAGWYKDSACTQAWDFETGIPGDMTLYAKWTAAGSSGETEATATPTPTAVTTPQPTKTQTAAATTSAPQATTAAGVSPTLTQAPAPVAGALFGLLAAGVLLRRRFQ